MVDQVRDLLQLSSQSMAKQSELGLWEPLELNRLENNSTPDSYQRPNLLAFLNKQTNQTPLF